jgi:hypothetical protein
MKARGVPLLSLAEGARRFVDEIAGSPDEVVTVIGGELGDGALGAPATPAPIELAVKVDRRSFPYLSDHAVEGRVVLPMVMAVEWFLRAVRDVQPHAAAIELSQLRVLRGVRLEHFDGDGDLLTVRCQPSAQADRSYSVELRGQGGARCYSATIRLGADGNGDALARPPATPALGPWSQRSTYDGHILFHGPRFQMIRAIEGVSDKGIAGELVGLGQLGWSGAGWQTDPVALDGALQLAGLWACHVLGGATLPMAFSSYRGHRQGPLPAPLRCIVWGREAHSARALCDVVLLDGAGSVVAELAGVENIIRPGELAAVGGARAI